MFLRESKIIQMSPCSICFEMISEQSEITTNCNHLFHEICLQTWLLQHDTCPLCRKTRPLKVYTLLDAIDDDDIEKITDFLANGVDGTLALIRACNYGDKDVIELLLEHGVNPNGEMDGSTALTEAAEEGSADIIELLLDYGANINHKDRDGVTAFMWAAGEGNLEAVTLLLNRGASVHHKDNDGGTALTRASEYDEIVELIYNRALEENKMLQAEIKVLKEVIQMFANK